MDSLIKVSGLGKRYRLGRREKEKTLVGNIKAGILYPLQNFKEIMARRKFKGDSEDDKTILWALRDINFEVAEGEVLGIIGHNGSGKSTLLKILSRITEPTTGKIQLQGRVSSLLEVGTGFHNELSGRDNVFMNGTILGMKRQEVAAKFDEIVEFSGVIDHIDTPVKYYSSGMKVRLAFAVAAHLDPEILIIDEVLAVGDLAFQKKCLGKMNDVAKSGRTVLFVSHNMAAVESLCTRCLLLDHGRMVFNGTVHDAIAQYRRASLEQAEESILALREDRQERGRIRFTDITLNGGGDVYTCRPLEIEITYESKVAVTGFQIAVKFCKAYQEIVMSVDNTLHGVELSTSIGMNKATVVIDRLALMPGDYLIDLYAGTPKTLEDKISNTARLTVLERDVYESGILPARNFNGLYLPEACEWTSTLAEKAEAGEPASKKILPKNRQ